MLFVLARIYCVGVWRMQNVAMASANQYAYAWGRKHDTINGTQTSHHNLPHNAPHGQAQTAAHYIVIAVLVALLVLCLCFLCYPSKKEGYTNSGTAGTKKMYA